ncbi:hypothetical protein CEXT_261401 [Caerostris extrusa]|uniref:Uncharacterized protein n=1 Tax=Caerostris extrusa TaxID=172846 RepID=A0AAV4U0H8_CAEEX|nr:hypothetical protein CEXT_261401 [Caerostris extrusa]
MEERVKLYLGEFLLLHLPPVIIAIPTKREQTLLFPWAPGEEEKKRTGVARVGEVRGTVWVSKGKRCKQFPPRPHQKRSTDAAGPEAFLFLGQSTSHQFHLRLLANALKWSRRWVEKVAKKTVYKKNKSKHDISTELYWQLFRNRSLKMFFPLVRHLVRF